MMMHSVLAARNALSGPLATVAGGAVPWWLAGGVNQSDVVAAWQPKGAASYADSLRDLTGNGYDAYPGVDPSWTAADGWSFDGSTQYLKTNVIPIRPASAIVRFDSYTKSNSVLFGAYDGVHLYIIPQYLTEDNVLYMNNYSGYNRFKAAPKASSGVLAFAGERAYRNGADEGITLINNSNIGLSIYIGARHDSSGPKLFIDASIQALAVYSTTLTAAQVAAITAAMQAL